MKISECKNAPEWLVSAQTENADVEVLESGWVIWKSGSFLGGDFLGGSFLGGDFLGGIFLGGDFLGGSFLGGDFLGGSFRGGSFLGGLMMPHCRWIYGQDTYGNIIIGCKRMKLQEWEEWFAGTEELSTRRGTPEFAKIQACFEATKAFVQFMEKSGHPITPIN